MTRTRATALPFPGTASSSHTGAHTGSAKAQGRQRPGAAPPPEVIEISPAAHPARMRPRHWGLVLSFLLLVLLPLAVTAWYLWTRAEDQYASVTGFTVRSEETAGASDLLGGVAAQLGRGGGQSDTDILYEFIQSPALVAEVDARFDLRALYSQHWETDPVFALHPDASLADLTDHWQRVLRISYDGTREMMGLRVLAFDPASAQAIARDVLERSQALINTLNSQARTDTLRHAETDLIAAQDRLRAARGALIRFRTRTRIVDPETDLSGRLGVVNRLQVQLAEALIEMDLLRQSASPTDPRLVQARQRIAVIRDRITEERSAVTQGADTPGGTDYPGLLAEYEGLVADREFAEQGYRAALTALDQARTAAARQTRYLATYVSPTLPDSAEYPRRWTLFGLTALFLLLAWSILTLIYYSIRDSR